MIKILSEGGYFFMMPLAVLLIAVIILAIRGNISSKGSAKTLKLLQSLGLFALVWGILGQVLGLIEALDTIEFIDGVTMNIVAGGLKRTFLPTFLGAIVFLFARVGIIVMQLRQKQTTVAEWSSLEFSQDTFQAHCTSFALIETCGSRIFRRIRVRVRIQLDPRIRIRVRVRVQL